jgi:hypothetical protein
MSKAVKTKTPRVTPTPIPVFASVESPFVTVDVTFDVV